MSPDDANDAARLVAFACQPRQRPLADRVYQQLLERYRSDVDFRELSDAIADGLGVEPIAAHPEEGLVVHAQPEKLFAYRLADARGFTPTQRMLVGLIHLAIAARAYPTPSDLDAESIRRTSVAEVDGHIRTLIEQLRRDERDDAGLVAADAELDTAWREYEKMPSQHLTGGGKLANSCTHYWITWVLDWLVQQGLAQRAPEFGAESYRLLHRFRLAVTEAGADAALDRLGTARDGDV